MRDDAPRRLKHDPSAPPALSRALDALQKGSDDGARLERVGAKLGALLDAPPPAVSSAGAAAYKAPALKLILGGLLLLAPLAWWMRGEVAGKSQENAPAQPSSVLLAQPSVATIPPAAPQPAAARADAPAREVAEPALQDESGERQASRGAAAARVRRQTAEARQISAEPSAQPTPAGLAEAPQPEQEPAAAIEEPEEPGADEAAVVAKAQAAKPTPSEAQLLMAARKAMPDDAERALRLLSQHQQHYADGVFVPEREVLAIEALRSLGRSAEASSRLRQFKAQYPGSFHLRRLQRR